MLAIEFDITHLRALVVTHCHIDHVGRIPYLLAAGFDGPIYCSSATALLLPMVIDDALKVGGMRGKPIARAILKRLAAQLVAVDYGLWCDLPVVGAGGLGVKIKFKPAGHILGSAYVEFDLFDDNAGTCSRERVIFSGDLGACYTPLLPAPVPPYGCDTLVIESTYGDKLHHGRKERRARLKQVLNKCLSDNGVVLIPAFSIGRTQELLYEIEDIIARLAGGESSVLAKVDVIVDSPLAAKFTEHYKNLKQCWDKEARQRVGAGRHPLSFEQLTTVESHQQHLQVLDYLANRKVPAIVIAASGMCSGGRIVNYLTRFIELSTTDVLFVGYQARGTLGQAIIKYGERGGYVDIGQRRFTIGAKIHQMSGYSAHADQKDLLRFVKRMRRKPNLIKIVHGDDAAKSALRDQLQVVVPSCIIEIPKL